MRRRTETAGRDALIDFPCACATVRRAARVVTQLYDGHLRSNQIEGTQFALLSVLGSQGSCSQAAIGHRFALDKTTLSRNLKLLKNKGWIETTGAEDGRERRYVLTVTGQKRLAAAKPAWRRAQEHLRSSMSAKEWAAMWKVFRMLTVAAHTARSHVPTGRTQ
ncbi:MAG: winged helix-turn-helix transcriptional regulator [Acidobacteria bacterium]|nr:winged helix-turn-helix transcriptional regulator [Acidobacteriota bacterium]